MPLRRLGRTIGGVFVAVLLAEAPSALAAAAGPRSNGPGAMTAMTSGAQAFGSSISADGRWVSFTSGASALVPGDTNGVEDVFVNDTATGVISRVSVSSSGMQGDGPSFSPSISGDGRFVAFASCASNLTDPPARQRQVNIYIHDRLTNTTTLASRGFDGAPADGPSLAPSISGDGRLVAFESDAHNLVPDDHNRSRDIILYDRVSGRTRRLSVGFDGSETERPSFAAAISGDGQAVAFASFSARLVKGDTNDASDMFIADVATGKVSRVSVSSAGEQGDADSFSPTISADGSTVAFTSWASNLTGPGGHRQLDVYVHHRESGATLRVSRAATGDTNGISTSPVLSAAGDRVAFASEADNLVAGDTNGVSDIFIADLAAGTIRRVSVLPGGGQRSTPSVAPRLDATADSLAYTSFTTDHATGSGTAPDTPQIYLVRLAASHDNP